MTDMRKIVISLGNDVELALSVTDRFDDAVRKVLNIADGRALESTDYVKFLGLVATSTLEDLDSRG